jgi:hypothetical protein
VQLIGPYGLASTLAGTRSMATDLLGKLLSKMRKVKITGDITGRSLNVP